jgi:hypothetical protein
MPAWPFALAVLPAGFAVAELTGVRALGGAVLVAGGLATLWAARAAAPRRQAAWAGLTFAGFVVSHLLADALGSWPAVMGVAALAGAAGWVLLDGGPRRVSLERA